MFDLFACERMRGNEVTYMVHRRFPDGLKFTKVEMLAKDKVMRFTFNNDNIVVKTVCQEGDTFSFETAFYIALAKYLSVGELNAEGVSAFAKELRYYKKANRIVASGIKTYYRGIKEAERAAAAEKEAKLIKERQRAKKIKYKAKRAKKNTKK